MDAAQVWQSVVLPFVSAGFGGWLTAQFALGRFRKEKIWERKTAAYTAIFEAIFDMGRWTDAHLTARMRGGELDDAVSSSLAKEYREARIKMDRRIISESWLLPEACITRIQKLFKELDSNKESWDAMLVEDLELLDRATKELRALVRRDLGME